MSKTQTPHSKHNENNNCADCHPGSKRAWKWRKSIEHLFVYCNKQPSWLGPHWFPQHRHAPRQYGIFRPKWAGITPVFPSLFPEATWPARLVCVWPCHLAWLNVSTLFLIPLISRGGCQLLFLAFGGEAASFWMPVWSAWTELFRWKLYWFWALAPQHPSEQSAKWVYFSQVRFIGYFKIGCETKE